MKIMGDLPKLGVNLMTLDILSKILPIARIPDSDPSDWLEEAEKSVDFLKLNLTSDEVVIYASGPHMWIHSVLTPDEMLNPPDHSDLSRAYIALDNSWSIERVYGGGELHGVYLKPPLDHPGCKSLIGSEKLVSIRSFDGVKGYEPPIEISQKLVHALGLHFMEERNAYCRLDDRGDIDSIIKVYRDDPRDQLQRVKLVTIQSHDLATYMALTDTSLVCLFDFTRFAMRGFNGWPKGAEDIVEDQNLFYRKRIVPQQSSYVRGHSILRTTLSPEALVKECRQDEAESNRQYASFLIIDRKNGNKVIESPCSPKHIVNYFTESQLPWEISPAFFRPEVLQKYKADPEKYTIDDRSISCRNAWYLRGYDINDAGQVHAYIGYLARLPYDEQLYWKSFNEEPKAYISERAIQSDILGEFTSTDDPLQDVKRIVTDLDQSRSTWWKPRGSEMRDAAHYPVTDSVFEWGNEILALDHLVVEGFLKKPIKGILDKNGGSYEKDWGSLRLLEAALTVFGSSEDQAKNTVAPLYKLHHLRNVAKAHGDPDGSRAAIGAARKAHGTLKNQFTDLSRHLASSLELVVATLPK